MTTVTDFSIESILGIKKEKCQHVPRCVSQSALLAEPPRHQARRNRTHFAEEAVMTMQRVFEVNPYPDILLREQLARQIGIPESRIQVWFQNRRNRNRRSANRNRKPTTAPLTLFETSDDARHAEIMSSAVKDPLFSSLPTLISPLPVSPTFHPRLFSMFHFSTSPVSPLPLTPVRSDVTFMFPEILPCRSWMKLSDTSTHFARPADYLCSSRFSPDSANEYSCDDSNTGDDDDDQLIIDFDAC